MLEAFWAAFEPCLREVVKDRLSLWEKENAWKRSAIGKFMALYESMVHLEEACDEVYAELVDLSREDGVLSRVVMSRKLERLGKAGTEFIEEARAVRHVLGIYKESLRLQLTGVMEFKGKAWAHVELWVDMFPTANSAEGKTIEFVDEVPTREWLSAQGLEFEFPSHSRRQLQEDVKVIKKRILSKLKRRRVDLVQKDQIKTQLPSLKKVIEEVNAGRRKLAVFIKDNFPPEKIMG
jgi:hypothetical protein